MRTSPIEHPPRSRFVILRPHYVELCGHGCAAMLLAVIEGWTTWRLQQIEIDEGTDESLWLRLSNRQLEEDLAGAYGRAAIRTGIEKLVELGFITINEPESTDRTKLYALNIEAVNKAVISHRSISDNGRAESDVASSDIERCARAGEPAVKNEGKEHSSLSSEIEDVWNHYVAVFNATRQTLDSKRKTIIRNALKVRSVAECKRAIDGLHVSPFHNGENQQQKKYLGIRYALSGIGTESPDERIDKMIDEAESRAPVMNGKLPSDHHKVQRALREVRYTVSTQGEKARGRAAFERLVGWGYKPKRLDEAPWVVLETA